MFSRHGCATGNFIKDRSDNTTVDHAWISLEMFRDDIARGHISRTIFVKLHAQAISISDTTHKAMM
jgi:hypothetical protein